MASPLLVPDKEQDISDVNLSEVNLPISLAPFDAEGTLAQDLKEGLENCSFTFSERQLSMELSVTRYTKDETVASQIKLARSLQETSLTAVSESELQKGQEQVLVQGEKIRKVAHKALLETADGELLEVKLVYHYVDRACKVHEGDEVSASESNSGNALENDFEADVARIVAAEYESDSQAFNEERKQEISRRVIEEEKARVKEDPSRENRIDQRIRALSESITEESEPAALDLIAEVAEVLQQSEELSVETRQELKLNLTGYYEAVDSLGEVIVSEIKYRHESQARKVYELAQLTRERKDLTSGMDNNEELEAEREAQEETRESGYAMQIWSKTTEFLKKLFEAEQEREMEAEQLSVSLIREQLKRIATA